MITRFLYPLVISLVYATLVTFPVSLTIHLPYFGRIRICLNLSTVPIFALAILWASQCLGGTTLGGLEKGT